MTRSAVAWLAWFPRLVLVIVAVFFVLSDLLLFAALAVLLALLVPIAIALLDEG